MTIKATGKGSTRYCKKRGLTESALIEVNKLYTIAKNEKNDVQVIKALLYRMQLQQMKEENALERSPKTKTEVRSQKPADTSFFSTEPNKI